MLKKKLYTVDEANNLTIKEVQNLYKEFINPNQTKIYASLPFDSCRHIILFREGNTNIFSIWSQWLFLSFHLQTKCNLIHLDYA